MSNIPTKVIVHHTAAISPIPQFEAIDQWHKDRGFPRSSLGFYVGYHYVIEKDGELRTARREGEIGAHTIGENESSIAICLVGNFDNEDPTPEQRGTLGDMLLSLCARYALDETEIWPHRSFANKSCYGRRLGDDWARAVYLQRLMERTVARLDALPDP